MKIAALQKTSLLDYPEKISAIIFTQGCNFRCGYYHNPELTLHQGQSDISVSTVLDFLETRNGKLDGVVIAMDVKAPFEKYNKIAKTFVDCVKLKKALI